MTRSIVKKQPSIESQIKSIWGPCTDNRHPCPPFYKDNSDCFQCRVNDTLKLIRKEDDMEKINPINCSVTVMPIFGNKIGFIRRAPTDTFPNTLVAPGGRIEETDGTNVDGVMYFAAEDAAIRELKEETGIEVRREDLYYFCSLVLSNNRLVISLWADVADIDPADHPNVTFLTNDEIRFHKDFAPGMQFEAIQLIDAQGLTR